MQLFYLKESIYLLANLDSEKDVAYRKHFSGIKYGKK